MTDIVERLRAFDEELSPWTCEQVANEAADEIERLQTENKRLIEDVKLAVFSDSEECKLVNADNRRLREALEAAYEYIDHATGALPIIRAALVEGKNA